MPFVFFYKADVVFRLKYKSRLQYFIPTIFQSEGEHFHSIHFIFCSDEYLLKMNQQFLKHDYFTDILTFDLSEDKEKLAEIYISINRVEENSKTQGVSFENELNRIIFHGVLHLCGYKDKSHPEKKRMTEKEDVYLKRFDSFHVKQNTI